MTERWDLLSELATPARRKLALERLSTPEMNLVGPGKDEAEIKRDPKRYADVKVALLLVQIMNPWEKFSAGEEAVLRGVSSDTVARNRNHIKPL